jgi:hypothetical protein
MVGKVDAPEKANMMEPKAVKKICIYESGEMPKFFSHVGRGPEGIGSSPACVVKFPQAWRVKLKITCVRFYRDALRHICVTARA